MLSIHILILGQVTDVGFRAFVVENARRLGVGGWVRNTGDNVEAVLEGDEVNLEKMLTLCQEGPPAALVSEVKVLEKREIDKRSRVFEIR